MARANTILKATIESFFDTTVMSAGGSALRTFPQTRWAGVGLNAISALFCGAARWVAEVNNDTRENDQQPDRSNSRLVQIFTDRTTPLVITALVQLGITVLIGARAGKVDIPVVRQMAPSALFCVGDFMAAGSVLETLFKGAAREVTSTQENTDNALSIIAKHLLLRPNMYWAAGLIFAGAHWLPALIVGGAMLLEATQAAWKTKKPRPGVPSRWARFMEAEYIPTLTQGVACFAWAAVYAAAGQVYDAVGMALYGASYFTYAAEEEKKYKGVIKPLRSAGKKIKGFFTSSNDGLQPR